MYRKGFDIKFRDSRSQRKGLKMKKTLLFLIIAAFFVASIAEAAPTRTTKSSTRGGALTQKPPKRLARKNLAKKPQVSCLSPSSKPLKTLAVSKRLTGLCLAS